MIYITVALTRSLIKVRLKRVKALAVSVHTCWSGQPVVKVYSEEIADSM
jgi:hypothetical protein